MRFGIGIARIGVLAGVGAVLALAGCGSGVYGTSGQVTGFALTGRVMGGQRPIAGAAISLYAAGTTGYGTGAVDLLGGTAVTSDTNGNFSIPNSYTCPSASTPVYLVSSGGDPGSGVNSSAVLMLPVGSCSDLSTLGQANISEVSSVAAVYGLGQFMTPGSTAVGTSSTNVTGLLNAYATVFNLIDPSTGYARTTTPAGNGTVPQNALNTLANVMAACVNTTSGSGACNTLFTAATPIGGVAPTDTLSAMLNIARNPGLNVKTLYDLSVARATFQPSLAGKPNDLTLSIEYTGGGLNRGQLIAVDGAGNVWVPNAVDPGTLSEFSPTGAALSPSTGFTGGGLSYPEAVAIDLSGYVWAANEGNGSLSKHSSSGTAISGSNGFTMAGMLYPYAVAVDGAGNIFSANGNNTVSKMSDGGAPLALFQGGGLDVPYAIAIDNSENVWIANGNRTPAADSVSKFSNSGSPAAIGAYTGGGLSTPVGVAVDATGDVWLSNFGAPTVSKLSSTGAPLSGAGYATPNETSAIAVDGSNTVWTANLDGSVSHFADSGTALSPATGYVTPGATAAVGIAVDASGNVWMTDFYVNSLFEYVGAASPTVVPMALAVKNQRLGMMP